MTAKEIVEHPSWESYWALRAATWRAKTVQDRQRAVMLLLEYLELQKRPLQSLDAATLSGFLIWLTTEKIRPYGGAARPAASTMTGILAGVRGWLGFLFEEGYLLSPVHQQVPSYKSASALSSRRLSLDEVEAWLELPCMSCPLGIRDRALFELAFGSGLRRGELLALQLGNVDLQQAAVHVDKSKNGRSRLIPITRRAVAFVGLYLEKSRPDLIGTTSSRDELWIDSGGGRLSYLTLGSRVSRLYAPRLPCKNRARMHALRHAFATQLVRGGADVRHVGEMLGHQALGSTLLYTEVLVSDLRKALSHHPRQGET